MVRKSKPSITLALLGLFALLLPALGHAQGVIEKRTQIMEDMDDANKAIRAAVKEKDYATIEAKAKLIADSTRPDFLKLFPKGSVGEKSEAVPAIWEKWDEFGQRLARMHDVAQSLQKAAAAKNDAEVTAQAKAMGGMRSGACGDCHLSFNKKRMKK